MIKNVHILVGLPGSGKTCWAKQQIINGNYKDTLFECDELIKDKTYSNEAIRDVLVNEGSYGCKFFPYNDNHIYIDGLFLTESAVETVIDSTFEMMSHTFSNQKPDIINFIIEQWNCDREACLYNDRNRINKGERDQNSALLIKNIQYDEFIDVKNIELHHGITMNSYPGFKCICVNFSRNEHIVNTYNEDQSFVFKHSPSHNGKLYSESWSQGGHWGDCWGNEGIISAETPKDFEELDKLLETVCPKITFLQYKKLFSECVTLDEYGEGGYYGTYEYRARYICNLENLYNYLKEHNLI